MAPTFSTPRKTVTVTATIDSNRAGWAIQARDVENALQETARQYGVDVQDLSATVEDGPRTVTLTEEEYNALLNARLA